MKILSWLDEKTRFLDDFAINCIPALKIMVGTKEGRRLTFYRPSIMLIGYMATLFVMGQMYEVTQSIWLTVVTAVIMVGIIAWAIDLPSAKKG